MQRSKLRFGIAVMTLLLSGCVFDERALTPTRTQMAVHAVLDPHDGLPYVLLEDVRVGYGNGDESVPDAGTYPISDAEVLLYSETGDSAIGIEGIINNERGVYYFRNDDRVEPGSQDIRILRGVRYGLRVRAPGRAELRAQTTIPDAPFLGGQYLSGYFNRDRDTLSLSWPAASGARQYAVWIESANHAFRIFEDGLSMRIDPRDRQTVRYENRPTFLPGRDQDILVTAVDRNYFDYYRSYANPLTGTGLLSNVEGGTGVFGSIAVIRRLRVQTVGAQREPFEGLFERVNSGTASPPLSPVFYADAPQWIDLYADKSRESRQTSGWEIVGRTTLDSDSLPPMYYSVHGGALRTPAAITISLLLPGFGEFEGRMHGTDSIVGRSTNPDNPYSGEIVYVKRRVIR